MDSAVQLGKSVIYWGLDQGKSFVSSKYLIPTLVIGVSAGAVVYRCTQKHFQNLNLKNADPRRVKPKLIAITTVAVLAGAVTSGLLTGIAGTVSLLALASLGFGVAFGRNLPLVHLITCCSVAMENHLMRPHDLDDYTRSLRYINASIQNCKESGFFNTHKELLKIWVQRTLNSLMQRMIELLPISEQGHERTYLRVLKTYPAINELLVDSKGEPHFSKMTIIDIAN